jgi:hypothetical protein
MAKARIQFKFGDMTHPSIGSNMFNLPTPRGVIRTKVHVVHADVPLLLGLDILDKYKLVVNNVDLTSRKEEAIRLIGKYCGMKRLRASTVISTYAYRL